MILWALAVISADVFFPLDSPARSSDSWIMPYRRAHPRFTVFVEAGFSEDGTWTIDARVQYRDGKIPPLGSRLLGEGRTALLVGIGKEGLRGRALGATRVKVTMDAGDGPVDIPPDLVVPEAGPTGSSE